VPVDDHAATHPGAEDHAKGDRRCTPGAVQRFGEREAVRVVGEADFAAERALEVALQRTPVEARGIRVAHAPGCRRKRPRRADADAAALADFDFGFTNETGEQRDRAVVIARGCGFAAAEELGSPLVERDDLGLRAA
jgi:hypothetical protein